MIKTSAKPTIKELENSLPQTGRITWISIRPEQRSDVKPLEEVRVIEDEGLEGDHYSKKGGNRQVTFIQAEHLKTVQNILNLPDLNPGLTRRNIVVEGINLLAFKDRHFQVGDEVVLEVTGKCHPCSRMEENLGAGGYNAMRGHGGITTKVIRGGTIKIGDEVKLYQE